jgi:hypothetical protein
VVESEVVQSANATNQAERGRVGWSGIRVRTSRGSGLDNRLPPAVRHYRLLSRKVFKSFFDYRSPEDGSGVLGSPWEGLLQRPSPPFGQALAVSGGVDGPRPLGVRPGLLGSGAPLARINAVPTGGVRMGCLGPVWSSKSIFSRLARPMVG